MKSYIKKILKEEVSNIHSDLSKKIFNNLENATGIKPEKIEVNGSKINILLKDYDYFFNCDSGFTWSMILFNRHPEVGDLQRLIPNYNLNNYDLNFIPNIKVRKYVYDINNGLRDKIYSEFDYLKDEIALIVKYRNCVNDYRVYIRYKNENSVSLINRTDKIRLNKTIRNFFSNKKTKITYIKPNDNSFKYRYSNLTYYEIKNSFRKDDEFYMTKEELFDKFLLSAKNKYGEIYRYDIENYIDNLTPMKIYCKKHKSYFEVTPKEHISGKRCPHDNESKGENLVRVILEKNKIPYKQYHKLKGCFVKRNERCFLLTFDFYLPKHNTVIEYDGRQHYEPVDYFGGEETYQRQVMLDSIKNDFCKDSGIKMIRIPYDTNDEDVENIILNSLT